MFLARFEGPPLVFSHRQVTVFVLAIQQVVGRSNRARMRRSVCHLKYGGFEEIVDHDRAHVDVVIGRGRAMNDDRATDTSTELSQGVAVIPARSIGRGVPGIHPRCPRSDAAFRHAGHAILVIGSKLPNTVPVDGGGVVLQQICHFDLHHISLRGVSAFLCERC